VVAAVVGAVSVPVTVKMRAGWSAEELTSVPLAREFERLGVRGFALHARTAQQGFEGAADWAWIREVRQAVGVPVIGNGDVRVPEDAARMLDATGCHGVMIGRAAIGDPWIVRDTVSYLRSGTVPPPPSLDERIAVAMEHLQDLAEVYGEDRAVRHLRGQLPHYVKGYRGASDARERIVRAVTIGDVRAILEAVRTQAGPAAAATEATGGTDRG
jgi:nifR3 family TIM-barrel protein